MPRRSGGAAKRRSPRRCSEEETRTRPRTRSQEQTKTLSTQDWIIRGKTRRSGRNKATTKCGGRSPDAPDWNIPGGTSGRGRRPPSSGIRGQVAARRPGRAHPGRNKEHGHPSDWIILGQAAAERHGLHHPGWIKQHEPPQTQTESSRDKGRPDAPDWNIRGGTGSRSHRTHDTKVEGHVVHRRPGLEHLGQNKKERRQPPGPGKDGMPPRAGMPGVDQPEGVPTPRAGASRGKWRPEAKETAGRDQGGAAKETRPETTQRTRPRKCREAAKWTRARRRRAAKMRTGPWCGSKTYL